MRAITVPFKDCGSTAVTVTNLDFDCEEGKPRPCTFIKSHTYHGKISFTTTAEIRSGEIVLYAIIGPSKLPFPFDDPDICSGHNLTCPMAVKANEVLTIELKVPSFAPTINFVAVKVKPFRGSSTSYMCVEFLSNIVNGNNLQV